MPKVESLRKYPVAGFDGYEVSELVITPEAIVGNKSFAVVLTSELEKHRQDPSYVPLRMTQARFPELTLFTTAEKDGKLVISIGQTSLELDHTINAEPPEANAKLTPFRAASSSTSKRWAIDCGDEVAAWLSKHLSKQISKNSPEPKTVEVRLVKAVVHPEGNKYHFTWYTDLHAVTNASLTQLASDAGKPVDPLTFRYNALISGTDAPFDEETWAEATLGTFETLVELCERCGYIGVDRLTGIAAHHLAVTTEVMRNHEKFFGVYFKPPTEGSVTLRVGDKVTVKKRSE